MLSVNQGINGNVLCVSCLVQVVLDILGYSGLH